MKSASVAKTNFELKACFSFYITFIIISGEGGGEVGYGVERESGGSSQLGS